jgi:hypothetical protein
MLRRNVLQIALAAAVAVLGGCSTTEPSATEAAALNGARERWEARRLASYRFELQRSCFCEPEAVAPLRITVAGNTIVETLDVRTGQGRPGRSEFALTVDELFDVVEDAIRRRAHHLLVRYHPEYGYPTHVAIDYDRMMVDEEVQFTAGNLQPFLRVAPSAPASAP